MHCMASSARPHSGPRVQEKPGCTLTTDVATFEGLMTRKVDAMAAFNSGKLKIGGNPMLAQKLQILFRAPAKL